MTTNTAPAQETIITKLYFDIKEVSSMTGLSETKVYNILNEHVKVPKFINGRLKLTQSHIDKILKVKEESLLLARERKENTLMRRQSKLVRVRQNKLRSKKVHKEMERIQTRLHALNTYMVGQLQILSEEMSKLNRI